jgi:hypothetical protein
VDSCDRIRKLGGLISQANVARDIKQRTGRSIAQTIRNNITYRTYINQSAQEGNPGKRAQSSGDGGPETKIPIADDTVRAYVQVLETEAKHLRKSIALLREGVAKLRPIHPVDIAVILGDPATPAEGKSKYDDLDAVLTKDAIISISRFLSPEHLKKFHCRTDDGEIVSSTEATLMDRKAVRALVALTKRYGVEADVPKP